MVKFKQIISGALSALLAITMIPISTIVAKEETEGQTIYEFDGESDYSFKEGKVVEDVDPYGSFSVSGSYSKTSTKDVPSYYVEEGILKISYTYNNDLSKQKDKEWHIVSDSEQTVNNIDLDDDIANGALILQVSKDRKSWATEYVETNAFENKEKRTGAVYSTTDVQLNSGCYYRLIVAYKLGKYKDTTTILFYEHKNYDYKKYAEVYEFYAYNETSLSKSDSEGTTKYSLGEAVLCDKFEGYAGEEKITSDDFHYGWNLGNFFITGHTDVTDTKDNPVILKNVGDEVALWFNLEQDINALNGDENLSITSDESNNDVDFKTDKNQFFGKGALIVQKTDYQNIKSDPQIYTNFLEADITPGTDTVVQLFEEGDYKVALDYEVTKKGKIGILDQIHHYRISFEFSVRNSNCMVYPLDVKTDEKLINGSYSKNGFYLDLAKSRYLQLNVKKSELKDGTSGLVEDTEFNQLATDGTEFTEEGLYEITVSNKYTNITDVKRIYVGDNDILKAYAVTGLSIDEIKKKVSAGAVINEDGTIGEENVDPDAVAFAGLDDENLIDYVEDDIYLELVKELSDGDYFVEDVEAKYVSKDYLENLTYNSRNNLYFGYDASELNDVFDGEKYTFTLSDDGQTTVKAIESVDDTTNEQIMKNVLVGSGVILLCVTVSAVTTTAAPAVSVIFAASATTGTQLGLGTSALAGIGSALVKAYQTGDFDEALKAGTLAASEGFKWGAISGAVTGGAKEALGLYKATEGGLTMNQVVEVQKSTGYPLDVIKNLQNMEQVEILKKAGLTNQMVGTKSALVRNIDLTAVDEMGRTNLQRMTQGLAPLDPDGVAYELHHVAQKTDGTLAILTQAEHRSSSTYNIWHDSTIEEGVQKQLEGIWDKERKTFWKEFAKLCGA